MVTNIRNFSFIINFKKRVEGGKGGQVLQYDIFEIGDGMGIIYGRQSLIVIHSFKKPITKPKF
jgi:hypothetical protein